MRQAELEPRILCRSSRQWCEHFQTNLQKQRVNWQLKAALDRNREPQLVRSLQAWQRGETSDGRHLLRAAQQYAVRIEDPKYVDAIRLFIREEQKHGENLGLYLDHIGAPRIKFDLGDWLFRRVRYFNSSIELWTITVIIVEMFAQFYYASIARAAKCPLLRDICKDILADEAPHIRFQAERLRIILAARGRTGRRCTVGLYRLLFRLVAVSIWIAHGVVFRRNGYSLGSYWQASRHRFAQILVEIGVVSPGSSTGMAHVAP